VARQSGTLSRRGIQLQRVFEGFSAMQGSPLFCGQAGEGVGVTCCFPKGSVACSSCWKPKEGHETENRCSAGHAGLMVLKTLDVLGSQHGYGIARAIEQISGDLLAVNQGTLYPVLLKLEQEGAIESEWGASENNRRARFYRLTRAGRKLLEAETRDWEQTAAIIARFF